MPDDRHLVAADDSGELRQWSIDRGQEVTRAAMKANGTVYAIALSMDGRWIVSGDSGNKVIVWNADTHRIALQITDHTEYVYAVDISSDSTQIASGSQDYTVQIFNIISGARAAPPIHHNGIVVGVKFSPDGTRIAKCTFLRESVRIHDTHSGNKLFDIPVKVTWAPISPLAWSSDGRHLFVGSPGKITSLDTFTSSHSDWPVQNRADNVSIATRGQFIAYSAGSSVSFWDYTSRQQVGSIIDHARAVNCISISHNGRRFACGHDQGITVHNLGDFPPLNYIYITRAPLMQVTEAALESWTLGNPAGTETILSEEIARCSDPNHYALAARSLIRSHLRAWETAIEDAEMVTLSIP